MFNWKQINRMRVGSIRYGERLFARTLRSARTELKDKLKNAGTVNDVRNIAEKYQVNEQQFRKAWDQFYTRTGLIFAKRNYQHLNKKKDINDIERNNKWTRELLKYVEDECANLITLTIRNEYKGVQRNARKAIDLGAKKGWGAERIADELIKFQGAMDKYKAMRIARTEVVRASNQGAMIGVKETGIALKKVWLATDDGRTRDGSESDFNHVDMDNVEVELEEAFEVSGEKLDYPGDPNGSEGNTINCRCAVAFEPKSDRFRD